MSEMGAQAHSQEVAQAMLVTQLSAFLHVPPETPGSLAEPSLLPDGTAQLLCTPLQGLDD